MSVSSSPKTATATFEGSPFPFVVAGAGYSTKVTPDILRLVSVPFEVRLAP